MQPEQSISAPSVSNVEPSKVDNAPAAILTKAVAKADEVEEDAFNPYESEVLKAQLQQVSDIYAENIKYPISSQPIANAEDVREYKEFEQAEVDLPFPTSDDDENPIRISAATDRFQYFQGDVVNIRVLISGAPEDVYSDVKGTIAGALGDVPIDLAFQAVDRNLTEFRASFDSKLAPANSLTPEMLVKLEVNIDGRALFTTVAFKYAQASAQIVGVQNVQAIGPNLVIPLQLNVFKNGYFFVNAVLEDATSGRPLIQLQAEQRLQQGNGIINLNAHISALQQQGSEGPYVVRSIQSYRGAEVGENFDEPASTSQARFNIPGFPFSSYEDQEYVDELAQERLDFLRTLGDVDEDAAREQAQQQNEAESP